MKRDLTKGSVRGNLLHMALPTMLGFLAQTLYEVIDMMFIGAINHYALAGVTIFVTIFWLVQILNEIIGTSSISLISQAYGSGDTDRAKLAIEQTLSFKFIVAVMAGGIIAIVLQPLSMLFTKGDQQVMNSIYEYGYLRLFFMPMMFSSFSVNTALRCIGDAKKPLYLMAISSVLNVVLDAYFMFGEVSTTILGIPIQYTGLNMGIFGASLATVISMTVAFLIGFYFLLSGKSHVKIRFKKLFTINKEMAKQLMTIGLPNGVESLIRNVSGMALMFFVSSAGAVAVAAVGIGTRISGVLIMPLLGLMMGGSAIVGQNIGVNQIDRAEKTAKESVRLGLSVMLIANVLVFFYRETIAGWFNTNPAVVEVASQMIVVFSLGMIGLSVMFGLSVVFSGSGYNKPFLIASIYGRATAIVFAGAMWLMQMPIVYLGIAYLVSDYVEMIVMIVYYRIGKWKTHAIAQGEKSVS